MQHATTDQESAETQPPMLGSETRFKALQEFALGKLQLNLLVPQAPCLLGRGQAKQGSWVRPGWTANASSLGLSPGLGGAQANLQDARCWAGSQGEAGFCSAHFLVEKCGFPQGY